MNKKVKVGSSNYEIIKRNTIVDDDKELLGYINYDKLEIHLSRKYSKEKKEQIFLHELVHGMFYELGNKELCENEGIVDSLSKQLYILLKENKNLFDLIK